MLLDWPEQKTKLEKLVAESIRRQMRVSAPLVSAVSHFFIAEGHRAVIVDAAGNRGRLDLRSHEASVEFSRDEMLSGGTDIVARAVKKLGETLGQEVDMGIIRTFDDMPRHVGGRFGGSTADEVAEQLLDVMRDVEFDFDYDGNPTASFVVHPDSVSMLKSLEDEPELSAKLNLMMEKKRNEWAARESRRRLAD